MASISQDAGGGLRIQFTFSQRRHTLRIGRVTRKTADAFCTKLEGLIACRLANTTEPPEVSEWIRGLSAELRGKLERIGLLDGALSRDAELGPFLRGYLESRTDVKGRTLELMRRTATQLIAYLGDSKLLRHITIADANGFHILQKTTSAPATAARTIKRCKQFFSAACDASIITENPFRRIKPGAMSNDSRLEFVSRATIAKVLDACPNSEWRAIVALARFGGVRTPSELLGLRWGDINWNSKRFLVHSPKLEKTRRPTRWVPLFVELEPHLAALFEEAAPGDVYLFPRLHARGVAKNLRTQLSRIIHRAGVPEWGKLFQNLRSSRQIELCDRFPGHIVSDWLGNSIDVAREHYLSTLDEHFEAAVRPEKSDVKSDVATSALGGKPLQAPNPLNEKSPCFQGLSSPSNYCTDEHTPPEGDELNYANSLPAITLGKLTEFGDVKSDVTARPDDSVRLEPSHEALARAIAALEPGALEAILRQAGAFSRGGAR